MSDDTFLPGDVVAVGGAYGQREGLIVGSHYDYLGRQVLEVRMDAMEVVTVPQTIVTRHVKRVVTVPQRTLKTRTVERQVYW